VEVEAVAAGALAELAVLLDRADKAQEEAQLLPARALISSR
jgi:hypothetical protein